MSSDKCKAGSQSLDPKLLAACGMDPKNPRIPNWTDFIKYDWETQKSATSTAIPISSSTVINYQKILRVYSMIKM